MDFIKTYGDGIIDRLVEEGATLSEEPLVSDPNGSFAAYEVNISETGEDNYLKFAHSFAEDNYPNEFGTPSATAVQILLKSVRDRGYKGVDLDIGAVFYIDESDRNVVLFRVLGGRVYLPDGSQFETPDLQKVIEAVSLLSKPSREIPEVGED